MCQGLASVSLLRGVTSGCGSCSTEYLSEPVDFVKKKFAQYGLIFKTNIFGANTVLIGGAENVQVSDMARKL